MRDFTHSEWQAICEAFVSSGFAPLSVSEYLSLKAVSNLPKKYVIFRHDVDRRAGHALLMAELEAALGIHATYYFRVPYTLDTSVIAKVAALGHEAGFHYECLSKARGDVSAALTIFSRELAELRTCAEVTTICMHGRPLSKYDNRDLWKEADFTQYGIAGDAYLSVADVCYFTDTGRSWASENSVRDKLAGGREHTTVASSEEFIAWIRGTTETAVYVTAHPERWARGVADLVYCSVKDGVMGAGKRVVRMVR